MSSWAEACRSTFKQAENTYISYTVHVQLQSAGGREFCVVWERPQWIHRGTAVVDLMNRFNLLFSEHRQQRRNSTFIFFMPWSFFCSWSPHHKPRIHNGPINTNMLQYEPKRPDYWIPCNSQRYDFTSLEFRSDRELLSTLKVDNMHVGTYHITVAHPRSSNHNQS